MISIKRQLGRSSMLVAALVLGVGAVLPLLSPSGQVSAAGLFSPRKLTMSSAAPGDHTADINGVAYAAGDGGNGAKAKHTFNFTQATSNATIGAVLLQYCTTPFFGTACTAPTGMDASTVSSAAVTNFPGTLTLDTTTDATTGGYFTTTPCSGSGLARGNCVLYKEGTPTASTGTPAYQIVAGNGGSGTDYVKNPTSAGTFYVRITTFSDNTFTTAVDQGVVTGSISNTIDITSRVQEQLNFSIGNAYTAPSTTCVALNNTGALNLGNSSNNYTLDPSLAYDVTSYFRLSTNATQGTTVQYSGDTLKTASGTAIASIGTTPTLSTPGTPQFGLGLNSGDANQSLTNLAAQAPYDQADGNINTPSIAAMFAHDVTSITSPKTIASVGAGTTVTCDTGSVRYIGNISTTTKPGVYQTSIAYIATPAY